MKTEIPAKSNQQGYEGLGNGRLDPNWQNRRYCNMHQPLEFTPEELERMDDDRSEREVYRMEDARDDNSNPPDAE